MKNIIGADVVKLAGLQIDTLQKVRNGQITLGQWERFNNLSTDDRETQFGDWTEADEEKLLEGNRQFLTDTFVKWYNKTDAEKSHQSVKIVSPQDIDWEKRKDDIDKDKFGEYTINPETISIDWENIPPEKIKAFDFAEFVGRPRWELAKHLAENYSDKYHIPGIECWKYLYENQDKFLQELKDGNYYYFFGSIFRDWSGYWNVPGSIWGGGRWYRDALWLEGGRDSNDRVLLLKK